MRILQESKVILEVDVPSGDKDEDQINFELDDDGNDISGNNSKQKTEPEEEPTEQPEEGDTADTVKVPTGEEESEPETEPAELPDEEGEEPEGDDLNAELPDEEGEEAPGEEEGSEDTGEETEETPSGKQNELINKERELFSDLTDKQLSIRDKELRGNYLRVYNTCNDIIENIKLIPKTSANLSVLEFINDKLEELKDFVTDYISNTYHTKTYLENEENYQYYIVILNKIDKLFKDLAPKK